MAISTANAALKLIKKLLGKSATGLLFDFYEEAYNARQAVLPSQVWRQADEIPDTAPALASGGTDGVVQYLEDEPLTAVGGTTNAFRSANLIDTIPFNHGDGTSYNYVVKDSLGNVIPFGLGDWIFDPDTGILTFFGTVPGDMPPTMSCYQYIGEKGVGTEVPLGPSIGSTVGSSPVQWFIPPTGAVEEVFIYDDQIPAFKFARLTDQSISALIRLPSDYTAGTPIFLSGVFCSEFSSTGANDRPVWTLTSKLFNGLANPSDTNATHTNSTSTGGTVSNGEQHELRVLEITSSTGYVGSFQPSGGDHILLTLTRKTASEANTDEFQYIHKYTGNIWIYEA